MIWPLPSLAPVPVDTPAGNYTYTCEATCDGYTLSHKFSFEIKQSGTQFTGDGTVKTYNGDTQTTTFTADDTITVKATPTATGEAPSNSAMFAASFTGPGAGQMAVFVGSTQVSEAVDAAGTVNVNISVVAKVEKNGSTIYVDAAHFANAIAPANGNDATFTMLQDVMLTGKVNISCSNGAMISQTANALLTEGATGLTIEGGTFRGAGGNTGLYIQYQPIVLVGGTFEGIECVLTTMKEQLKSGYCYYDQNNKPIALTNEQTNLTGTVTVKKCNHTGEGVCEYTHATGTTTHQQTCLACGKKWDEENCSYTDSRCACGSTLSVALAGTERLIYDGNPREPGVTVTLDGTKLAETDYGVTYANNINAGTDTATVTVKGKENYSFEIKKTFSIEKAEQKDFAATAVTTQYEKNGTFTVEAKKTSSDRP